MKFVKFAVEAIDQNAIWSNTLETFDTIEEALDFIQKNQKTYTERLMICPLDEEEATFREELKKVGMEY